jgi:hypothetical protein
LRVRCVGARRRETREQTGEGEDIKERGEKKGVEIEEKFKEWMVCFFGFNELFLG